MVIRAGACVVCLLLASAAAGETIYKYRGADGRTTYSNRLLPNAELIEAFEYKFPEPAATAGSTAPSAAEGDSRIKNHLAALDAAWSEVQAATKALALAEARLSAGVEVQEGEGQALAGPAKAAAPFAGGPQAPAAPAAGGPTQAALPAAGGPMGTRRGGGRNADYQSRMAVLEAGVQAARARLDAALRNYNQLR
ncbi:MAG: DUF4124 domain-containing protein [Betaproteobacteria bacterium]